MRTSRYMYIATQYLMPCRCNHIVVRYILFNRVMAAGLQPAFRHR